MQETKTPIDYQVEANRDVAGRIGRAWREIRRGFANNALRELIFEDEEHSIEAGKFDTLEQLVLHESIRMGDLADVLRIDPSTATRAVARLIKDGLAEKVSHSGDGRVVYVAPTGKGHDLYQWVVKRRRDVIANVVGELSEDRRQEIAVALEEFAGALQNAVSRLLASKK